MSKDKPKTLTLKKPLSLAKQAQISTTLGKTILEGSSVKTKIKSALPQKQTQETKPSQSPGADKAAQRAFHQQRQARYHQALTWLCETYPACFNLKHPKPLKIGILKDILAAMKRNETADQPSHVSVRHALAKYTFPRLYHQGILKEDYRYDLTGQTAEAITPQERDYAQEQLDAKEAFHQKRQASKAQTNKLKANTPLKEASSSGEILS